MFQVARTHLLFWQLLTGSLSLPKVSWFGSKLSGPSFNTFSLWRGVLVKMHIAFASTRYRKVLAGTWKNCSNCSFGGSVGRSEGGERFQITGFRKDLWLLSLPPLPTTVRSGAIFCVFLLFRDGNLPQDGSCLMICQTVYQTISFLRARTTCYSVSYPQCLIPCLSHSKDSLNFFPKWMNKWIWDSISSSAKEKT